MKSAWVLAEPLAVVVVVAAALVCGQAPLTGTPGPESAQILGIVGGVLLCLLQARRGAVRKEAGFGADLAAGWAITALFLGAFVVAAAIGSVVHESCAPSRGYAAYLVLSVPVLALQNALGAFMGRVIGRPFVAVTFALLVQIACVLWLFGEWYQAPSFRVTSHMFVVVSGDLLRGLVLDADVVAFRASTALFAFAVAALGVAAFPPIRRTGLISTSLPRPWFFVVGTGVLVVALGLHAWAAPRIAPSRRELDEAYVLKKSRGAITVHADPLSTTPKHVDAILAESTLWLERLEKRMGTKLKEGETLQVWLHASRDAQARWTGARNVDFTLPWRREIHIADARVPHPTLGHEIVHALAATLTDSLLGIPTRFVVLQNAGITEGLAVALTPELVVERGLTLREQAAALRRVGLAPSTAALFSSLGFWREASARAYVSAGAAIETVIAESGDPHRAIAALYGQGEVASALKNPEAIDAVLARHDGALDGLVLPSDALAYAASRFARPSILDETCSESDRAAAAEVRLLARLGDLDAAEQRARELQDPVTSSTFKDLYGLSRAVDDDAHALRYATALGALEADVRPLAMSLRGDALWRASDRAAASTAWDETPTSTAPPDFVRTTTAKRTFARALVETDGDEERLAEVRAVAVATLDFLVDEDENKSASRAALAQTIGIATQGDFAVAFADRAEAAALPDGDATEGEPVEEDAGSFEAIDRVLPLARYILGRQYVQLGALELAIVELDAALNVDGALEPIFVEQARIAMATAYGRKGQLAEARKWFLSAAEDSSRAATRLLLRDRADRVARGVGAPARPATLTSVSDPAWADVLLLGSERAGGF